MEVWDLGLKGARIVAALALSAVAALFLLAAVSLPLGLPGQAAKDRIYYEQFRRAAAFANSYAAENGRLPDDDVLQSLGDSSNASAIWSSLTLSEMDCGSTFKKAPNDRFTLSFWRGEWSECFAYPSGRTTLPRSVSGYLLSGLGIQWAVFWLIAAVSGYSAIALWHRRSLSDVP